MTGHQQDAAVLDAIAELEQLAGELRAHGPAYVRRLVRHQRARRTSTLRTPRGMSPALARVVREVADDAIVRSLQGPPA